MKEFVKRSLVLSEELAKAIDNIAESKNNSFAFVVREALNLYLKSLSVTTDKNLPLEISVSFTKEESAILSKISQILSIEPSGIIKQCWKESLPQLAQKVKTHKDVIEQYKNI